MPTFDIVNKINIEAFKNAVDGVNREIENRYDFKGSVSKIIVDNDNYFILAESDMKINQLKLQKQTEDGQLMSKPHGYVF